MNNLKCISCSCTAYKPPAQAKGAFLQFKQSCEECGHQASEHRKLTAVDQYIKSEVAKGKRSRCTASILPCDIPMSPVFSRYDLIPLPRDDPSYSPSMENSVECTCRGFKTPDVIRLCQKFRTHKLSGVAVELAEIACTFCNHPLSSHTHTPAGQDCVAKASDSIFMNAMKPALGAYEGLALTSSSLLMFPPVNSECLELMLPLNFSDVFVLLSVGNFQDSDVLMLAVVSESLDLTNQLNAEEDTEIMDIELSGQDAVAYSKRRLKAKQAYAASVKRRSRRMASKKAREEQVKVLKQLKGLKGIAGSQVPGGVDEGVMSDDTEQMEFTEVEHRHVLEMATNFTKKIDVRDNYHTYCLPQGVLDGGVEHPVMAAVRISSDSMNTSQCKALVSILVAVGAKEGSVVFVAAIPPKEGESADVLSWQQMDCPGTGTLGCLILRELKCSECGGGETEVLVAAGLSSGVVCVWKMVLSQGRLKGTDVVMKFNCVSQCVALKCSPDNKLIVAGTVLGEAVFCPLTFSNEGMEPSDLHLYTIQCCCAPVKCITWSEDGRLLAIGGCDDAIQVLQCVTPPDTEPVHKGSLLNYFKRDGYRLPRFIHTHTLKGHTSFVADLMFGHDYFLVSVGWDGQLLFWRLHPLPAPDKGCPHRLKARPEQPDLLDPVGGYKLGPSLAVEFLPVLLCSMMGCGLVIAMANKLGGVTLAGYAKPCQ